MISLSRLALVLALTGCVKTGLTRPAPLPEPLAAHAFHLPKTETRTLSNGLKVVVATNTEVPLWQMGLLVDVGGYADPDAEIGLSAATFAMLNKGAAGLTAGQIDQEFRKLGGSFSASSEVDGAYIGVQGLSSNLEPTLDLWAKVLLQPDFPKDEWEILRDNWKADLAVKRDDPSTLASRGLARVQYGTHYRGRFGSEETYDALSPEKLRGFYQAHVGPKSAVLLVGGNLTADQIIPLLEARLSGWKSDAAAPPKPKVEVLPAQPKNLYVIDKPGASQSVVRIFSASARPTEPGYHASYLANEAFGGSFTGRVNLNLREDKGYTYGARCFFQTQMGPSLWYCSTNVQAEVTGKALVELQKEIRGALGEKPLTAEEIVRYRDSEIRAFPSSFETTGGILDGETMVRRYGLTDTWLEDYIPALSSVDATQANEAFRARIQEQNLNWLVVGDFARIQADLEPLGFNIIMLDRNGNPMGSK